MTLCDEAHIFFDYGGFDKHPSLRHFSDLFGEVEIFHLHGGGYLNSIWPKNAFILGFALALKKRFGTRLYGTGLGVLPLPAPTGTNATLIAEVMSAFEFIETRDLESFNYIKSHGGEADVIFGLDDCFLHTRTLSPAEKRQGRWLHLSDFTTSGFIEEILAIVDRTNSCFDQIVFWECISRDGECASALKRHGADIRILRVDELVNEPLPVAVNDVMMTARFHPHLLAARLGAQGFFRTDKSYYDIKHRSLVISGSPFHNFHSMPKDKVISYIRNSDKKVNLMHISRQEKFLAKKIIADTIYSAT